jgi:lipoyl(octanoyl) transferase|tara:strand:+ start:92 stop:709 length:618 start_codon:yes stop_codon:yes gene_type:complete
MDIEVKISNKAVDYLKSIKILEKRVNDVHSGKKNELVWILEHNTIYTAGTSAKDVDIIDKKINVVKTNRGGKITFHGPGQKVVYFVLNLNKREKNIRDLVNKIENCIVNILKEYNIKSYPDRKNVGIWIGNKNNSKKIAAIGIRVKKWIAYHGFSLNICNDLSKYKKIIPCGIVDKSVTSLKENGISNFNNINKIIIKKFLSSFL